MAERGADVGQRLELIPATKQQLSRAERARRDDDPCRDHGPANEPAVLDAIELNAVGVPLRRDRSDDVKRAHFRAVRFGARQVVQIEGVARTDGTTDIAVAAVHARALLLAVLVDPFPGMHGVERPLAAVAPLVIEA